MQEGAVLSVELGQSLCAKDRISCIEDMIRLVIRKKENDNLDVSLCLQITV